MKRLKKTNRNELLKHPVFTFIIDANSLSFARKSSGNVKQLSEYDIGPAKPRAASSALMARPSNIVLTQFFKLPADFRAKIDYSQSTFITTDRGLEMTGKLMLAVHEELCLRSDDSIPWAIGLVSYSFVFYSFSAGGICGLPSLTVTAVYTHKHSGKIPQTVL